MKTIFLIQGSAGQWDDYHTWIVCGGFDKSVIEEKCNIEEIVNILKDVEDDMDIQVLDYGKGFLEVDMPSTHFRAKENFPIYTFIFSYKQDHIKKGKKYAPSGISHFLKDDIKGYMISYIKRCVMGKDIVGLVNNNFTVRARFDDTYFNSIMFCTSKIVPYIKEFEIIKA